MKNNKTNPKFLCDCDSKYGNECVEKYEYCICYNYWYKDKLFCEECIGIVKQVDLECDKCNIVKTNYVYPYPGYRKDDCNAESEHMCGCNCDECPEENFERSCGYCYDLRRKIMDEIIYQRDIDMKENEATEMSVFK